MIDDIASIISFADSQGWQIVPGSGHYKIYSPTGAPYVLPCTPSDWRATKNCVADLRRMGLEIPRKATPKKVKRFKSEKIEEVALNACKVFGIEPKIPGEFPHITEIVGVYRNKTWFDEQTGMPLSEDNWPGPEDLTVQACILADHFAKFDPIEHEASRTVILVADHIQGAKVPNARTQRIHFDAYRFWAASPDGAYLPSVGLCSCGWHDEGDKPIYPLAEHIVMRHERADYAHFPLGSDLRPWVDPYTISKLFDPDDRDKTIDKLQEQVSKLTQERDEARSTLAELRRMLNG